MFENVLGQGAVKDLSSDLSANALPPSLLFFGPSAVGKGTAALELARVASCVDPRAPWNCPCPACARHRSLTHPDLLLLGPRSFSAELSAASAAFLRDGGPASLALFARSARKLLGRVSPVLWEGDESKYAKVAALAAALNEELEEIESISLGKEKANDPGLKKIVDALCGAAVKLETEGVADSTPISQIRRVAHWARLAPFGKRKLVLIENADRMQEGARNALLKILEEPPDTTVLVLTTARRGAMMPTILSRLRAYEFARRPIDVEREVLRRVFRDPAAADGAVSTVADYLAGFLPVTPAELDEAAALFFAANDARSAAAAVLERTQKFEPRSLFPLFLERLSRRVAAELRRARSPSAVIAAERCSSALRDADLAVGVYNQSPPLALERLHLRIGPLREAVR